MCNTFFILSLQQQVRPPLLYTSGLFKEPECQSASSSASQGSKIYFYLIPRGDTQHKSKVNLNTRYLPKTLLRTTAKRHGIIVAKGRTFYHLSVPVRGTMNSNESSRPLCNWGQKYRLVTKCTG